MVFSVDALPDHQSSLVHFLRLCKVLHPEPRTAEIRKNTGNVFVVVPVDALQDDQRAFEHRPAPREILVLVDVPESFCNLLVVFSIGALCEFKILYCQLMRFCDLPDFVIM